MSDEKPTLSDALRERMRRAVKGFDRTLGQVAADIGCARNTLGRRLSGAKPLTLPVWIAIGEAIGMSGRDLAGHVLAAAVDAGEPLPAAALGGLILPADPADPCWRDRPPA